MLSHHTNLGACIDENKSTAALPGAIGLLVECVLESLPHPLYVGQIKLIPHDPSFLPPLDLFLLPSSFFERRIPTESLEPSLGWYLFGDMT
jgi:hypothetical protein